MAIQRWDPLRDLMELRERVNRLFDDVFARSGSTGGAEGVASAAWKPPMDIHETDDRFVVQADLPGVDVSQVEIEVTDDALVLRGERKMDPNVSREKFLRIERSYGRFSLQLALPPSVDRQGIHASHRDGVIELILPKQKANAPGRVKVEMK